MSQNLLPHYKRDLFFHVNAALSNPLVFFAVPYPADLSREIDSCSRAFAAAGLRRSSKDDGSMHVGELPWEGDVSYVHEASIRGGAPTLPAGTEVIRSVNVNNFNDFVAVSV